MDVLRVDIRRVARTANWPETADIRGEGRGIWRCPEARDLAVLTARVATGARAGTGLVVEMDEDIMDDHRWAYGWDIPIIQPSGTWPVQALLSVHVQVASLLDEADVIIGVSTVDDSESGRHYTTARACAHAIAEDMRRGEAAKPMRALLRWMAEDHARRSATSCSPITHSAPPPN